jgi:hypothetical protein
MKSSKIIVPVVLLLIGLGAGFFGGIQYRNYQISRTRGNFGTNGTFQRFTGTPNGQGNGAQFRAGAVSGSILSMDSNSITVKMADGSSKIVLFSPSTTYSNTVSANQSDLKVGSEVAVFGTPNSDGSVTATNIQINPQFGRLSAPSPTPAR